MPHSIEEHTGARVGHARKSRHLTQRELADRSNVSYSTITKMEKGRISGSPAIISALARALSVPVTDLTGQPYREELRRDQLDTLIQPIREALDVYDLGPDPETASRSLDELHRDAEQLCALVRATDLKTSAANLPGLIYEATSKAYSDGSDRAWQILASTYRTAYDVTAKLGFTDLCTVALDRMEWAAQHASDPVLSALRQYMRSLSYLRAGQYSIGKRLVDFGLTTLQQADSGRVRDVVTGQLHLGAAVLCARSQDGSAASAHLDEAGRIAERTGPAEKVHWVSFGPANVGVHRVAVHAEQDEYEAAVRVAKGLALPADWPGSRLSHHHAEVARAQLWLGQTKDSFNSLRKARALAPQQTKYHPLVRETFTGLTSACRALPETFTGFGSWLGV